jgi:glycosyltransferase involved in cell wall biosynthesis
MGIDILLRSVHRLVSRGTRVAVAIAGVGPEGDALKALCHELGLDQHVRFLGRLPDEQLPALLRAADLFVLPTRSMEGFGLVTIEAMACGATVVGTDNGATPEILGAIDPRLLAAAEPEALATAIERMLADERLRLELGARSLQVARSRYAWAASVANLDQVYGELFGSTARHHR